MGQRADGKYGGPDGESYTKFGEKTSEHGHWEVGPQYAGTNTDGTKWHNTKMRWVEDNRNFEAPASKETPVVVEEKPVPVQLSDQAAEANAYTSAYEQAMLPRQGEYVTKNDQSVAQDFKNLYEASLTNELREQVPGALQEKAEDIKQKDAYKLDLGSGLNLV